MAEGQKKKILIVDDEPDVRIFLETVVVDAGFEAITADNGKRALEKIKECKPDLISLDLVMPRMRGITLLKCLKNNPELSDIPFIVVTAHAHDDLGKEDFLKLKASNILIGSHSYIEKPIVPSEYINRIKEKLGIDSSVNSDVEMMKAEVKEKISTASRGKLEEILKLLKD